MNRCVNCGIATGRNNTIGKRVLNDEEILSVIRQWHESVPINSNDHICNACWKLAANVPEGEQPCEMKKLVGHANVCIRCGKSLEGKKSTHLLHRNTQRELAIYNVIREWILPRAVGDADHVCHSCWVMADRASKNMATGPSCSSQRDLPSIPQSNIPPRIENTPTLAPLTQPAAMQIAEQVVESQEQQLVSHQPAQPPSEPLRERNRPNQREFITLPAYMRAIETERRCFIQGCQRSERYRVPLSTRKMLLTKYKYYIPPNNRLCDLHLVVEAWDFVDNLTSNSLQSFTADHIQDMLFLKDSQNESVINFENIDELEENIVYTWIGFKKEQFHQILHEVPQLQEHSRCTAILAAYLIKLRSGDSDERLATLFKVSRKTFEKWLSLARTFLKEYYVPQHLGLHCLNRQILLEKNLMIPRALFEGDSRVIAIFDGTYCYIEKSSNYLYQKQTYSLHKYRNLMKPFLLVCTDGHIIDVLGPYPATTSDADIMRHEFSRENGPLKEFFQEGDVFILDRGFRDSLPLLREMGYRTYVPATVEEGETQLSTIEANKSRAVTICRWVVEVVNGRFKRDFKLLRSNYFNTASRNLFCDFEIAAALINAFHPPIVDRGDAEAIINIINSNMNKENNLANYVISNSYNRRRADFESITVQNDNLNDFPQLSYDELILISLGTYQLKQARSYFGEHVRRNEGYIIEVCKEISSDLRRELSASNNSWLLRGRIQSRHISRRTYFIYILVDSSRRGRDAILEYCCNCIVGRRTVGCCAHIMSIIWYLSWARYQENIVPPAQFLDDLLICFEDE